MYKYLFGPVPSRRLGMSLGVDLVPKKVCSLDCVYCEVGETTKLTTQRKEYVLYDRVCEELSHYFEHNPDPDYITFSGSGEPTLNSHLGDVLRFIKKNKPHVPIAVLTNGTLLYDKNVRNELKGANLVMPSLDAATQKAFDKINRPDSSLTIQKYVQGLIDFRNEFEGKFQLEVFILPGFNDDESELLALKEVIKKLRPDVVQLNTLDRPGVLAGLFPASKSALQKVSDFWALPNVEIIAAAPQRKHIQAYREDAESAILGTIARRPCTVDDLADLLGMHGTEINKYLDVLEAENKIDSVRQERGVFYQLSDR